MKGLAEPKPGISKVGLGGGRTKHGIHQNASDVPTRLDFSVFTSYSEYYRPIEI